MYYFEDLKKGKKIITGKRMVSGAEVEHFCATTGIQNPLCFDEELAKKFGSRNRVIPGALILGFAFGLQYQTGLFNQMIVILEIDKLKFSKAVAVGDTIWCEVEVISKKTTSRKDRGIIDFELVVKNQEENSVLEAKTTFLFKRRPGK